MHVEYDIGFARWHLEEPREDKVGHIASHIGRSGSYNARYTHFVLTLLPLISLSVCLPLSLKEIALYPPPSVCLFRT